MKVLVLEQHYVPGGFTHTFKRKSWRWDVGVHGIFERWHEDPRREWCGLVLVVHDLREPLVIELSRDVARFGHVATTTNGE